MSNSNNWKKNIVIKIYNRLLCGIVVFFSFLFSLFLLIIESRVLKNNRRCDFTFCFVFAIYACSLFYRGSEKEREREFLSLATSHFYGHKWKCVYIILFSWKLKQLVFVVGFVICFMIVTKNKNPFTLVNYYCFPFEIFIRINWLISSTRTFFLYIHIRFRVFLTFIVDH